MNREIGPRLRSAVGLIAAAAALFGFASCSGGVAGSAAPGGSPTSLTVSCAPATIAPGATSQCSANVQGGSSAVTWTATAGAISSSGLFTAPSSAGQVTVKATSADATGVSGTSAITVAFQVAPSEHVVLVMEENQSYSTVVGDTTDWPSLNALIGNGSLATNYYANTHPSIGNYFMLTAGQILTNDDSSTEVWNVDNIARRMLASGVSFKVYAEGIPQGYVGGDTGLYVIRHNPFAMLSDVAGDAQVANTVICPFSQFSADVANNTLSQFSFIVPNIDDDAHTGTPLAADTWLQSQVVAPIAGLKAFQPGGDGLLIVDFDEAFDSDTTNGGGHIPVVFWGPQVKAGYQQSSATIYQHQSMLLTMMQALGLGNPPGAAANAPSMGEFFVQP
jgi:acid phosphatase